MEAKFWKSKRLTMMEPDRVAAAIAFALVDRYGEDVGALPEFALATSELDPSKYKHVFENPNSFDEAWNHPDEFQRTKWMRQL